ncbi:MAG: hypothetical protein DBX59_04590 [Bacillota bacterium]|nr:MAG: hypothetical protein DBX59_04590 [Bacillota bacterium]
MTWVYIWLGVAALSIIIEFITTDLVSVWFIFGGLLAMVLALVDVALVWQLVAFIALSGVLLALCRKPILKIIGNNKISTNADSLIGKEFVLLTPIAFNVAGSVKAGDVVWTADTETDGVEIPAGETVRVVKITGNRLIVEKAE